MTHLQGPTPYKSCVASPCWIRTPSFHKIVHSYPPSGFSLSLSFPSSAPKSTLSPTGPACSVAADRLHLHLLTYLANFGRFCHIPNSPQCLRFLLTLLPHTFSHDINKSHTSRTSNHTSYTRISPSPGGLDASVFSAVPAHPSTCTPAHLLVPAFQMYHSTLFLSTTRSPPSHTCFLSLLSLPLIKMSQSLSDTLLPSFYFVTHSLHIRPVHPVFTRNPFTETNSLPFHPVLFVFSLQTFTPTKQYRLRTRMPYPLRYSLLNLPTHTLPTQTTPYFLHVHSLAFIWLKGSSFL